MSVYKNKNSPFWQIDFQFRGHRVFQSSGTENKAKAKALERRLREEIASGAIRKPEDDLTLDTAIGLYWQHVGQHAKRADDLEAKLMRLNQGLGPSKPIRQLTHRDLAVYVQKRREAGKLGRRRHKRREAGEPGRSQHEPLSAATCNREVTALRAVFRFVRETTEALTGVKDIAWRKALMREPVERVRWLTDDEEQRLMDVLPPDLRRLIRFALVSGARLQNCIGLGWRDVDFGGRIILLRNTKSRRAGQGHVIPLTTDLEALLREVQGVHPTTIFTFPCRRRSKKHKPGDQLPFTATNFRRAWKEALVAAEIGDFRFHDLRHTAASRLLQQTGNLLLVKRLLGHSTIGVTERYAHLGPDDLTAAMEDVSESRNSPGTRIGRGSNPADSSQPDKSLARKSK